MNASNATVIATFSRRMRIAADDGSRVDARVKGRRLKPVCGDRVLAAPIPDEEDWLITGIGARDTQLARPNMRGETEVLAANFDLLLAVAAPMPKPDWFIIDRYLCAAELAGAWAGVVFNKMDIAGSAATPAELEVYERIGYPVEHCSAETGSGIDALESLLAGRVALFVGQSGVGKSSLINVLTGDMEQTVGDISAKTREGRHTTANSVLLPMATGGAVIDSPGVRDFAPAFTSPEEVQTGFREVREAALHCRFANCRHLREPGCEVKRRIEAGDIDERRYESYRRASALADRLDSRRF
jgi:ribosome biogenesis GTPase